MRSVCRGHLISISLLCLSLSACGSSDTVSSPQRWVLTMADEFDGEDGSAPSSELWEIETGYGSDGWGNDEWQLYTSSSDNVRVERKRAEDGSLEDDGYLVITAQCDAETCGKRDGTITSGRIKTQRLFQQKHGRFEARIKLPEGAGYWPAFWMLGANIEEVSWPDCGEIDIMENVGRRPEQIFGTVHGPGYSAGESIGSEFDLPEGETFADDFHVFAVEWDPSRISFWVDGEVQDGVVVGGEVYNIISSSRILNEGEWVFNNEFFLLLNLAVGGTVGGSVGDGIFPGEVLVDYVRVYERSQ